MESTDGVMVTSEYGALKYAVKTTGLLFDVTPLEKMIGTSPVGVTTRSVLSIVTCTKMLGAATK